MKFRLTLQLLEIVKVNERSDERVHREPVQHDTDYQPRKSGAKT